MLIPVPYNEGHSLTQVHFKKPLVLYLYYFFYYN